MLAHHLLAQKSLLRGLNSVAANPQALAEDLAGAWEVLGEAVQTLLRRYGRSDAYELLKDATRGKAVDRQVLEALVGSLPNIPVEAAAIVAQLHPHTYTGLASQLAEEFATMVLEP